jgi:hypothetical protein
MDRHGRITNSKVISYASFFFFLNKEIRLKSYDTTRTSRAGIVRLVK